MTLKLNTVTQIDKNSNNIEIWYEMIELDESVEVLVTDANAENFYSDGYGKYIQEAKDSGHFDTSFAFIEEKLAHFEVLFDSKKLIIPLSDKRTFTQKISAITQMITILSNVVSAGNL